MSFDTAVKSAFMLILLATPLAITYDVLFSKPKIMEGIIVEKVYVPSQSQSGQNILPYMKYKSLDYIITVQKEEQWIAFVQTQDGKILKVNCHVHNYEQSQVGDTLRFKEYRGEIFHIDYFSHNEDGLLHALRVNQISVD
jgi:hypothetical protein